MQSISIAANEAGIFIHLDRNAVTAETVTKTVNELTTYLQEIASREQPSAKAQDLSFLRRLPTVSLPGDIAERYKYSTFSRQEL
jgi:hypothetical protein